MRYSPYKSKQSQRLANIRGKIKKPMLIKNGRMGNNDSNLLNNTLRGDVLGTGIIGGLDFNILTIL